MPFVRVGHQEYHETEPETVKPLAAKEPVVLNCSMDALKKVISEQGKTLLLATTPTCPHGKEMKEFVRKNMDKLTEKGVTVTALEIDTRRCSLLADQLEIKSCPTLIFYDEKKEINRIVPEGESWDEMLEEMLAFKQRKLKKVVSNENKWK